MEPITQDLDNAAIHAIAKIYGPCLEKLNNYQQLNLISILALWVGYTLNGGSDEDYHWSELEGIEPDDTVENILNQCDDLAPDEALVFITAIANCITV
jgi:hypothetical protein